MYDAVYCITPVLTCLKNDKKTGMFCEEKLLQYDTVVLCRM